ncbi:MAG: hypothetical protein HUU06_14035 [Planctomycetaceae bacterium]|nr:hypothetical protein [Planctomycetaceae bacterium]
MRALGLAGILCSVAVLGTCIALGGTTGLAAGAAAAACFLLSARALAPGEAPGESAAGERRFLASVVGWAFFLRLAASIVLHATGTWSWFGGDEETFDLNGRVFAGWVDGQFAIPLSPRFLGSFEVGYFYLVGSMYSAYGLSKGIPLLVNALLGAALVLPVHALAGRFAGRAAARRAALLAAFFPSLVLWSSLMVRDVLALFCLASVLLVADRLRRSLSPANLLALVALLAALASLRTYIFLIVGVALAGGIVLGQRSAGRALLTGALLMFGLIFAVRTLGIGQSELERANLETLAQHRHYNALGPSVAGSLGSEDISTPTAALTYLPVGMAYFLLSPLPWQIGSPRQILSLPDLVLWYSILPAVGAGLVWLLRRRFRAVLPLLFTVVGITVLYSLVEGNIGIIFRHRAQIIVPLCAVAGAGTAIRARARARRNAREAPRGWESPRLETAGPLDPAPGRALGAPAGVRLPAGPA